MATYLFPALLVLLSLLLAGLNLLFPQIVSLMIVTLAIIAAWAIIKINEG